MFLKNKKMLLFLMVILGITALTFTMKVFVNETYSKEQVLNLNHYNWQDKVSEEVPFTPGETFHIKYITNTNSYVYCADYPHKSPDGVDYNFDKEILDPGKVYIMSQAVDTDNGSNYLDYYYAQVAYWIYDYEIKEKNGTADPSGYDHNVHLLREQVNDAVTRGDINGTKIRNLVDTAKSQSSQGVTLDLSTDTTQLTFTISDDGKYFISNDVKVVASDNYTITVDGPKGTAKEDIEGGFRVKVPYESVTTENTTISASISSSKQITKAFLYTTTAVSSTGRDYQAVVVPSKDKLSKTISLSGVIKKNGISISKADATTGKEVPGAELKLKDENGNIIDNWISASSPHIIEGLKPGKYYLIETLAPNGYELNSETVEFIVKKDGTVDNKVVMLNKEKEIINPKTGSVSLIASWIIALVSLGFSITYFFVKKTNKI